MGEREPGEEGFLNNKRHHFPKGLCSRQFTCLNLLTSWSQLSKMSISLSISQMRKLKLRVIQWFISGPTALCGQAGGETNIFEALESVLLTSPLHCLI